MQEVTSVAFSPDNKYLAAQGGGPEWNLVLWSWEKSKAMANVKTSNLASGTVRQVGRHLCPHHRPPFLASPPCMSMLSRMR